MDRNRKDFTKVQSVVQSSSDNQGTDIYKSDILININCIPYFVPGSVFGTKYSAMKESLPSVNL